MSETNKSLEPVDLPLTTSTFEANGHKYHVERNGRLSISRAEFLEKFSIYSLMGRQPSAILVEQKKVYEAINAGRIADAAVLLDNCMKGMADLISKESPLYYICTLFINREGEDKCTYDLELGKQKIADWREEGLVADFFLKQGLAFIGTSEESWSKTIQSILGVETPELAPLSKI